MTGALLAAAAVVAALGAAMLVLSEGRRALSTGLLLLTAGLVVVLIGRPVAEVALGVGGAGAAVLRLRSGIPGWVLVPTGSTPRVLLTLVSAVVGAFVAVSLLDGPGEPPLRVALVVAGTMVAARLLSTERRDPALASAIAVCLVLGALAAAVAATPFPAAVLLAGLTALVLGAVPGDRRTHE